MLLQLVKHFGWNTLLSPFGTRIGLTGYYSPSVSGVIFRRITSFRNDGNLTANNIQNIQREVSLSLSSHSIYSLAFKVLSETPWGFCMEIRSVKKDIFPLWKCLTDKKIRCHSLSCENESVFSFSPFFNNNSKVMGGERNVNVMLSVRAVWE